MNPTPLAGLADVAGTEGVRAWELPREVRIFRTGARQLQRVPDRRGAGFRRHDAAMTNQCEQRPAAVEVLFERSFERAWEIWATVSAAAAYLGVQPRQ